MVLGSLLGLWVFVLFGVAIAVCLNRVLAPEGKFLSFAPPKERNQRKGGPDAALILRAEAFERGCSRSHAPRGNAE